MFKRFYPDTYLDSAYEIDFEQLYKEGCRGIIFDIDNTLVPHGAPSDERSRELFRRLKEIGFSALLLSNNKEQRVKSFNEEIGAFYIFKAGKPSTINYKKAMEMLGTDTGNTVFVGDQLFTDIWGAKKTGIRTFLTKPIHPKEEIQIVLKRKLEKIVLFFYRRQMGAKVEGKSSPSPDLNACEGTRTGAKVEGKPSPSPDLNACEGTRTGAKVEGKPSPSPDLNACEGTRTGAKVEEKLSPSPDLNACEGTRMGAKHDKN